MYNNAGSLPALHARLMSALVGMGTAFEIIYVNDASDDESFTLLAELHASGNKVAVVDLAKNVGQSSAVLAALSIASGEIIVTIDADLENHPEDIPALVAAVRNGADLACGVRQRRSAPILTRTGPSLIANRLVGCALGIELDDWGCGLNAVAATIVRQLLAQDPLPSLPKIEAALLASRIAQVPVGHSEREHGQSEYTVRRLCAFAATFLRSFSISRTLRRFPNKTMVDSGALHVDANPANRSLVARATEAITAFAAWLVLTALAIILRAWQQLFGTASNTERFQIREILTANAGNSENPHCESAGGGIDQTTLSREVGRTL